MVESASAPPDEQLVSSTLSGDDSAYAELTRRYKTRIFGLVSRFTHDSADLEDLCQDIFIQAYFKLRQFRRDSPFEHWLLRIATYKCYDFLRRKKRNPSGVSVDLLLESGYEPRQPEAPVRNPEIDRLYAALAQLKPQERLVITLLELEEKSLVEIAQQTGWSIANVKIRAFRARAALRKIMEQAP